MHARQKSCYLKSGCRSTKYVRWNMSLIKPNYKKHLPQTFLYLGFMISCDCVLFHNWLLRLSCHKGDHTVEMANKSLPFLNFVSTQFWSYTILMFIIYSSIAWYIESFWYGVAQRFFLKRQTKVCTRKSL